MLELNTLSPATSESACMNDEQVEPKAADPLPPLLVPAERVASLLSISTRHVRLLDATEQIPVPLRIGRRTLWRVADIEGWVAAGCPSRHRWELVRSKAVESEGKSHGRHS